MLQLMTMISGSNISRGLKQLFNFFPAIITVKNDPESFDSAQILSRFIRQFLISFISFDKSFDGWLFRVNLRPDNGRCSFMCKMKYPGSLWHGNYGIQHACNIIFSHTPHYSLIRIIGDPIPAQNILCIAYYPNFALEHQAYYVATTE